MGYRYAKILTILGLAAMLVGAISAACADEDLGMLATEHSWLPWPEYVLPGHPLMPVVTGILSGDLGRQPPWKLPMLVNALQKDVQACTITAYCSQCADGGGHYTRWGSRTQRGICAADPKYWGPGSVVWIGPPINEVLIVEDTGGAVKGPDRFDVCMEGSHHMCIRIGRSAATYVPLNRVEPKRRWGTKPKGWHPPVWATPPDEVAVGG
jgi:3D (Asp-Asp-Asp) domain-containing protein